MASIPERAPGQLVPVKKANVVARFGRDDRSPMTLWFWEIDRVLLILVAALIAIGLIAVAAASPASAQRYSEGKVQFDQFHYLYRQLLWVALSIPLLLTVSTLPKVFARRLALGLSAFFLVMLAATPLLGAEVNGAKRWIGMGFAQFQPSEFLKPCFIVSLAWLISLKARDAALPVASIAAGATAIVIGLLMLQPDLGQSVVFAAALVTLLLIAGMSFRLLGWLAAAGAGGLVAAYLFYPTATRRIDDFLFRTGDTYQTDMAHATLTAGGIFGTGPGGGQMKFRLPEAHTDYIYSVIGEEFGLVACLAVACVYLAILVRVFVKLLDEEDFFTLLASAGLATQFGVQAFINIAVNLQLAPSKGMTLPFISYGGSSMLALSLGFGLLLAFTRRNPYLTRSPYVVKWGVR